MGFAAQCENKKSRYSIRALPNVSGGAHSNHRTHALALWMALLILSFLGLQAAQADMPDYYSEPGVNPFRENNQQTGNEEVDPFSGKLQARNTDIFIPGNGGMDIAITRSYTSANSPSNMWQMHMGKVSRNSTISLCSAGVYVSNKSNPVLELPDGSQQVLTDSDTPSYLFISNRHWKAVCAASANGLIVTSPEGMIYEMTYNGGNNNWYASKITDRNGNWIAISYINPNANGVRMSSVTSSDGRSLTFSYSIVNSYPVLTSITDGSRTWSYSYIAGQSTGDWLLSQVTLPNGRAWNYTYNGNNGTNAGSYQLNGITNPQGGVTSYTYGFVSFNSVVGGPVDHVVTSKTVTGIGTWTYSYTPSTAVGTFDITRVTAPSSLQTTTYKHYGVNTVADVGEAWKIGLLYEKDIGTVQTEVYTWSPLLLSSQNNARPYSWTIKVDNDFNSPILSKLVITRDGTTYTTTYSNFDAWGNPGTKTEAGNSSRTTTQTFLVDTNKWILHQPANETVATSWSTTRTFDTNGNLSSETKYGVKTSYSRFSTGDISTVTDARNNAKTFSGYARGTATQENWPESIVLKRTVNASGTVASETDGENIVRNYSYDELNRITFIDYPINNDVTVKYDDCSFFCSTSGPEPKVVLRGNFKEKTSFDGFGRAISIDRTDTTSNATITTTFSYDALGRKTFESLPGSSKGTSYLYDELGRVTKVTHPDGKTLTYAYSSANTVKLTNERAKIYTFKYVSYGDPNTKWLTSITAPVTAANVTIGRNAIGQITSIAQNGKTRSFTYNANGYLATETNPETGVTTYGRDALGNMISRKMGTSATTTYTYDKLNRLTTITYPATAPSVQYTYNKNSQKLTSVSGGITRTFTYNANRKPTSETLSVDGLNYQYGYTYNANDILSGIVYPSGQSVTYTLDAFGRQTAVSPYATAVDWHVSSQPSQITLANGIFTDYTYQTLYFPIRIWVHNAASLVDSSITYDASGNIATVSDVVQPAYNRTLAYDDIDRITGANGPWGTGAITYEGRGNITKQTYGSYSLTYAYDTQERLSTVTGGRAYTFGYDVYGNATANGTSSFTYDDALNMRCVNCSGATPVSYDYDADHSRVKKVANGVATYSFFGADGALLGEYTPATSAQTEYVYLHSKLLAQKSVNAQGTVTTYYHPDVVGSPVAATDATGQLAWRESYWPYGDRNQNDPASSGNPLWFTGKPYDTESRLNYSGARYYDPLLGRFMGVDPVGFQENNLHSFNRYVYANNNPYKYVDPDGKNGVTAFGGLLTESYNFLNGKGFNGEMVSGALKDGYNGEGDGFRQALVEDVLSFGTGAIGDVVNGLRAAEVVNAARVGASVEKDFFAGTKYTDKVVGQMKQADFHAFPESVKGFQGSGQVSKIAGGDGVERTILRIPGEYKGKEGKFEFMKEPNGSINHRLFRPNKGQ